jgi:hypothetical protein
MKIRRAVTAAALAFLAFMPGWARVVITVAEDFEITLEDTVWRTGPGDEIVPTGGNPGAFLHATAVETTIPFIATDVYSIFTGPYTQMGVVGLGIDVNVFSASGDIGNRRVWLGLVGSNCELALPGQDVSQPGSGFRSYTFNVPSWKLNMPGKWVALGDCADWPRDVAWGTLSWVGAVRFYLGDPGATYAPQTWDIGFDNPRIMLRDHGSPGDTATAVPASIVPDAAE